MFPTAAAASSDGPGSLEDALPFDSAAPERLSADPPAPEEFPALSPLPPPAPPDWY